MIQVTLTFVSIEALRAALLEIPESSLVGSNATAVVSLPPKTEPDTAKVTAKKSSTPAATPAAAASTQPTAAVVAETAAPEKTVAESNHTAASVEAEPQASTAAPEVSYADLQKAVLSLHAKAPGDVVAIAKNLGFNTFKEMKDKGNEVLAAALAAVNAKLAELEVA